MDFALTDEERGLVETVRRFGERHFTPENVRQWRLDEGLPDEVVREFVQLDFNGFGVIHRCNHERYDFGAQCLVLEELARVSGATLPFSNDFLNLQIMEEFAGSHEFSFVREGYQSEGRLAFALAVSEPRGGSDAMGMETRVRRENGQLVLSGQKMYVNNGEYAPYLLVAAIDDEEVQHSASGRVRPSLSLWLVPRSQPGIEVVHLEKIGQSMLPFSGMVFNDVPLEEGMRLHGKRSGFPTLFRLLEIGRLFSCSTALGLAQAAMEDAVAFARDRVAFGQPISDFQMIQEKLVDMEVRLRSMRSSIYRSAWLMDNGASDDERRLAVALTKREVPAAATWVASAAMQIIGGRGYTSIERVSGIWQDCRGFQVADGTDEVMVHIAAPLVLGKYGQTARTDH